MGLLRGIGAFVACVGLFGCIQDLTMPWSGFPIDYGLGTDGDYVVSGDETINECYAVLENDGSSLVLEGAPNLDGRRILILHGQDEFAQSGDTVNVTKAESMASAGTFQLSEVISSTLDPGGVRVSLRYSAQTIPQGPAQYAQVCTVPQFSNLTVPTGARILANPWDGISGGLIAFFVAETATIDGTITGTGSGFRGGSLRTPSSVGDIEDFDVDTASGTGGGKGEGLDGRAFALSGRGNLANGGGGGNANRAGGGGGGNGGAGGFGGRQNDFDFSVNDDTRGMPGIGVDVLSVAGDVLRLPMGGGGGAGHADRDTAGAGGDGGGLVLIFANQLSGNGMIQADGEAGGNACYYAITTVYDMCDGAGGGGAGGTIVVRSVQTDFTGELRAAGGRGGLTDIRRGPGGGGAGGRIHLTGPFELQTISVDATGGVAGSTDDGSRGATDGDPGRVDIVF